jgi:hypothetical protein
MLEYVFDISTISLLLISTIFYISLNICTCYTCTYERSSTDIFVNDHSAFDRVQSSKEVEEPQHDEDISFCSFIRKYGIQLTGAGLSWFFLGIYTCICLCVCLFILVYKYIYKYSYILSFCRCWILLPKSFPKRCLRPNRLHSPSEQNLRS